MTRRAIAASSRRANVVVQRRTPIAATLLTTYSARTMAPRAIATSRVAGRRGGRRAADAVDEVVWSSGVLSISSSGTRATSARPSSTASTTMAPVATASRRRVGASSSGRRRRENSITRRRPPRAARAAKRGRV